MPLETLKDIVDFAAENSRPLAVAVGLSLGFNALVLTILRLLLKPIFFVSVFVQLALFMGMSCSTFAEEQYPAMILTAVVFALWIWTVVTSWTGWMMALNIQQVYRPHFHDHLTLHASMSTRPHHPRVHMHPLSAPSCVKDWTST